MAHLAVHELNKFFGERELFSGLTFDVGDHDRIGLVGANGCGKTTLFRILMGAEPSDGGEIVRSRETRVGYMEQHTCRQADRTLWDEVQSVFAPVMEAEDRLAEVNAALAQGSTDPELLTRQQVLREQVERMGGLYYRSRVRSTLLGLGFAEGDFTKPVGVLSGGQRSKAAMGRLLLADTNLLLLDEPTNHLDIPSVEWLEEYLRSYTGALIVISHDRYFLDRVTNRTMELSGGRLYQTDGSYSVHRVLREKDREVEEKHYKTAMQEIRHIEENITLLKQWNREKSIRAAESRQKRVDRLREELVAPEAEEKTLAFQFSAAQVSGNEVLTAGNLSMGFDGRTLFRGAAFGLRRGERVFLLGPNGCGKTTLLKILCERLQPLSGFVRPGAKVTIGYYDQTQANLDPHKTAMQELWDAYPRLTETAVRSAMAAFLFRGDEVYKTIGVMSGGERARLLLLKLMLAGDNLLLLDEPTNHLDIASREALEEALLGYDGTILAVSHDRYFINRLADRVLHLTPDGIAVYTGNYDDYADRLRTTAPAEDKPAPAKENDYKRRKEQESARRKLETLVRRTEEEIAALEAQAEQLRQELEDPETAADYTRVAELSAQLAENGRLTEEKLALWEQSQENAENFLKTC